MRQRQGREQHRGSALVGVGPSALGYVADLVIDAGTAADVVRRAVERRSLVRGRGGDVRVHLAAIRLVLSTWDAQPRGAGADAVDARGLVEGLPTHLRQPLLLHYWSALSVADIARALHRSAATVQLQLDDARRLLAVALETGMSRSIGSFASRR